MTVLKPPAGAGILFFPEKRKHGGYGRAGCFAANIRIFKYCFKQFRLLR
jgi:hypothetical protein